MAAPTQRHTLTGDPTGAESIRDNYRFWLFSTRPPQNFGRQPSTRKHSAIAIAQPNSSLANMASEITRFPAPATNLSILILGAGGREHALSFKLAQSPRVDHIFVAPGNGGTAMMGEKVQNVSIPWGGSKGYGAVVQWAKENNVSLVVPGPEQPLVEGVEQELRKGKSRCSTAVMSGG